MNKNPNILKRTRCYLIGAMQYIDGSEWRAYVQKNLELMNIIVFNPYNHPYINSKEENNDIRTGLTEMLNDEKYDDLSKYMRQIRSEDMRTVDISDFMFCYIDPKYFTCGSWEEFFLANHQKKSIFLVVEGGRKSCPLWVFGTIPHRYIYNNIDDALTMIKNIDNGTIPIDSSRWRLLREEFR